MFRLRSHLIIFFTTFAVVFLMLHAIVRLQVARQTNVYVNEINNIHTRIEDRFRLFIDAPLAVGITSSNFMALHYQNGNEYEQLAQKVLSIFDELLGLSILDSKGEISRVYPIKDNPGTLGKISQNFEALKISYKNNEPYWLSPPFDLYQGPRGFSFYVPMIKHGQLVGWIAPIISVERFFNKFIRHEFLETFHLVIQDKLSGKNYFETSELPQDKKRIHINNTQIRGREMSFLSWAKEKNYTDHDHWPFSALISFVFSLIAVYAYWLFEQKNLSTRQLKDVNTLLGITSRETSAALDGIKHQLGLIKQGAAPQALDKVTQHVSSIATMIQQITVLQRIAIPGMSPEMQKTDLVHLIQEMAESYKTVLVAKNIFLELPENSSPVVVNCNKWLICHSVLGNVLTYVTTRIGHEAVIKITLSSHKVSFSFEGENSPEVLSGHLEQGLYVAGQVMTIHQGRLEFHPHSIDVLFKV